jgi:hypothetical protein
VARTSFKLMEKAASHARPAAEGQYRTVSKYKTLSDLRFQLPLTTELYFPMEYPGEYNLSLNLNSKL